MQALFFRCALISESAAIAALVNAAYRGESSRQGWTTEADLLDGLRTTAADVQQLIESEHSVILVCVSGDDLIASVCLEKKADAAYIGMFVVNPTMQGSGIGKQLLTYAESYAVEQWSVSRFCMHVITQRDALISFYERRGYRRTGVVKAFPVNPEMWQPKKTGLQFELLEKPVLS
jgi:ribosomal protein S18 acetylase RimI-like enzyme